MGLLLVKAIPAVGIEVVVEECIGKGEEGERVGLLHRHGQQWGGSDLEYHTQCPDQSAGSALRDGCPWELLLVLLLLLPLLPHAFTSLSAFPSPTAQLSPPTGPVPSPVPCLSHYLPPGLLSDGLTRSIRLWSLPLLDNCRVGVGDEWAKGAASRKLKLKS